MKGVIAIAIACLMAVTTIAAQHTRLFPPTKLGDLEGPDRDAWQRPDRIMDELGIGEGSVVADLGAGGGWFTVRLAARVGPNGRVYAEDIQPEMIQAIRRRVQRLEYRNVEPVLGTALDPRLPRGVLDAALIVDAYYEMEQPVTLLKNLATSLKPAGRIGIVNFKKDGEGPGPPMEQRIDADRVIRDAVNAGLKLQSRGDFLRYHYLLVFVRASTTT
jgi:ubiquinone/menaquinone biosynthesis C-methylase UbiE